MKFILDNALNVEGLFRVSGDFVKIKELKQKYEEGERVALDKYNIHDVTGVFKLYFRELPECLLTGALYPSFIVAEQLEEGDGRKSMIQSLIELLPDINKKVLHKLLVFLAVVASASKKNQMNTTNLARCFGPNILFQKDDRSEGLVKDSQAINRLVKTLIEDYKDLF